MLFSGDSEVDLHDIAVRILTEAAPAMVTGVGNGTDPSETGFHGLNKNVDMKCIIFLFDVRLCALV